jgi:hypothetical protein
LDGAYASDTVIIIRPKSESVDSSFISQFLTSAAGQSLISSRVTGALGVTLSTSALRDLPEPVLNEPVATDLQELTNIEDSLRTQADRLRSLRLEVFSATSESDLKIRLRDIRQISKAIAASVKQAESMDFQIRNFYPYPLAYRKRQAGRIYTKGSR